MDAPAWVRDALTARNLRLADDAQGLTAGRDAPAWVRGVVAAWKPVPRLGGNEWAETERRLEPDESRARPGRWRSIPWQREILDALADPTVQRITILKAAQVGASELIRCAIGRWAVLDPGDVLWVMANQAKAESTMKKLRAMFLNTPALRPLLSTRRSKNTLLELVLTTGMRIVIGWAGSAQSLASDPFRYVVLDEVAKYSRSVKGEGSPIGLAEERTKTFGRRGKIILLSSPKHETDLICTSFRETLDRRVFAVPCPSCGFVQPVEWEAVRWPAGSGECDPARAPADVEARVRAADSVERASSAWVACARCPGHIQPHQAMWSPAARWVQEEPVEGSRRRAYHVPEFFHWESTISGLVARWLRCTHPSDLLEFWGGSLGRAYRVEAMLIPATTFSARAVHKKGVVPAWATTVIATADTQQNSWWLMVRAWGRGGRSRLLDWGEVTTEEELLARWGPGAKFAVEGDPTAIARPILSAIDTGGGMVHADGSRTKDVYELVLRTPRARALKGEGDREADEGPHRKTKVKVGAAELELNLVNKTYFADELATLVRSSAPVLWEECQGAEHPTYTSQMASEEKVLVTTSKGTKALWQRRRQGAANHLWDCARYQCWAAGVARVEDRRTPTWTETVRTRPATNVGAKDDGWLSEEAGWLSD